MKLSSQDTVNLVNILSTCAVAGIETIIIEDGIVRGVSEARNAAIISDFNVPKFPQKIGLGRLGALKQRMDLFSSAGTVIDAKESDRGEITSLEISNGRNRAQFRCTSTALIKAPKHINGDVAAKIYLGRAELKMVLDAVRVMGAKRLALCLKKDKSVSFELADATNDIFKVDLETSAELLAEASASTVNYYPADVFASVLRAVSADVETAVIEITDIGCARLLVHGHCMTLLPQINEEDDE